MSAIITLFARKGGVGRTTVTHNLAGACAEHYRVLVVDTDSQASISKNFFGQSKVKNLRPYQTVATIFDSEGMPNRDEVIHETEVEGVWVIPSSDHMRPFDRPIDPDNTDEVFELRDFLHSLEDEFNVILIDTPPNIHNLSGCASLLACDGVVTVVEPHKNACESVMDVKQLLTDLNNTYSHDLVDLGCLINNNDVRKSVQKAQITTLRRLYGSQVFRTKIMSRVALEEVAVKLMPIVQSNPTSPEADMFRLTLKEIVQRMLDYDQISQMEREEDECNVEMKEVGNG